MLHDIGYSHLKNILTPTELEFGQICIKDKLVDYNTMKLFISNIFLKKISKELSLSSPLNYVKFRVSDGNNSSDAAAFHRDIFPCTKEKDTKQGGFSPLTCLVYFDKTVMELIPKSHLNPFYDYTQLPKLFFSKSQRVTLEPGDILIFYSTLLHRGIFYKQDAAAHRRLLQVFECFPAGEFDPIKSIISIPGVEKYSEIMINLNRHTIPSTILNIAGFINSATGQGIQNAINTNTKFSKFLRSNSTASLSSEGLRSRLTVIPGTFQEINKYIINGPVRDLPKELYDEYQYACYTRSFRLFTVWIILIICCTIRLTHFSKSVIEPNTNN